MDIHQLRVFASVFKNRSFSRASEELHLTQPTISNHIKVLEDEFECKLFDRLGRSIIPTREAEALYSHSAEIIEKANALKEIIGQFKKELTGKLIIGASTIPGVYLMPRMMKEFQKKNPLISFQIFISDSKGIVDSISRHELLLGIAGAKLGDENIKYIPYVEDELIVVSPTSLNSKRSMTLKELTELPVVIREEGSGTRRETERFLESKGLSFDEFKVSGIFGSTDAIKQAVKAGLGVSILSRFAVMDELKNHTLDEIKLTDLKMKRKFYIVTHRKRTLPFAYGIFLEHLLAESKNLQ
ncbi:MAG: selenium metabolism-associated LysR family transcriptional regulator [Nitrospirota bacterium]